MSLATRHAHRAIYDREVMRIARLGNEAMLRKGHTSIRKPDEDTEAIVATYNGRTAGVLTFFVSRADTARSTNPSTFYVEIVWVRPQLRGKGIFRAMLEHLGQIGRTRRVENACFEVHASNVRMHDTMLGMGATPSYTCYDVSLKG